MSILAKIIKHKKEEVQSVKENDWSNNEAKKMYISKIKKSETSFYNALKNPDRNWTKLIAEVKKGSPSQGLIRENFDVTEIVKLYDKYAAAMSILTDEKFFLGSLDNLKIARNNTQKPLLRKDFIIDEFQIYEARKAGANAVLLLASVLGVEEMQKFLDLTHSLGMDALVEVHDEAELNNVLQTDAKIIGINNRNLKDFSIDLNNSNRLAQLIPEDRIIVSESGISSKADIRKVCKNVDAILVGTAITKSEDMEAKIRDIDGKPKIKICGITNYEDAKAAVDYGADYLGFIFYEKSPRSVSPEKCAEIIRKLRVASCEPRAKFVGVFVNKKVDQVLAIAEECGLDVVQLHGDETPVEIKNLKLEIRNAESQTIRKNTIIYPSQSPLKGEKLSAAKHELPTTNSLEIWKAIRVKDKEDLKQLEEFDEADGILLDTLKSDSYGGTGESFDWKILGDFCPEQRVILAGGLDVSNIAEAISDYHPDVLDLSSRIEREPGKKDVGKMKAVFEVKF